jgi:hypothetical protein
MPKRLSTTAYSQDVNLAAFQMARHLTGTDQPSTKVTSSGISRVMVMMGRRGGRIDGKRRLITMTPDQRHEVAQKAT